MVVVQETRMVVVHRDGRGTRDSGILLDTRDQRILVVPGT